MEPAVTANSVVDYDMFFRDNKRVYSKPVNGLGDSGMVIGADFRNFCGQAEALAADSVIPDLDFDATYIWAKYDENRQVSTVHIEWNIDNGLMILTAWRMQPEESDPYFEWYSEEYVTEIDYRGVSVIGNGLLDGVKYLYFQLEDGSYYQILARPDITTAEVGQMLDFFLDHGLDFSRFVYEAGAPFSG